MTKTYDGMFAIVTQPGRGRDRRRRAHYFSRTRRSIVCGAQNAGGWRPIQDDEKPWIGLCKRCIAAAPIEAAIDRSDDTVTANLSRFAGRLYRKEGVPS